MKKAIELTNEKLKKKWLKIISKNNLDNETIKEFQKDIKIWNYNQKKKRRKKECKNNKPYKFSSPVN